MLIIRVMGGLGNQMQQYALYEKYRSLGREARLDISWFEDSAQQEKVLARRGLELRLFDHLEFQACTGQEKDALLGNGRFLREGSLLTKALRKTGLITNRHFYETDAYHPEILDFTDQYLEGHWACEKYYHDIMPLLQEKIRFPESGNPLNRQLIERLRKGEDAGGSGTEPGKGRTETPVSIHIRRGDYLDPANAGMFGGICTPEYYKAAEAYIRERVGSPHFYLFSDDTEYLRENYSGREYTIVDWNKGEDSFYDMELMSLCRHNICANSTFSFWGARLNRNPDKLVIRPARHKNSQKIDPERLHELWEGWILVDELGNVV